MKNSHIGYELEEFQDADDYTHLGYPIYSLQAGSFDLEVVARLQDETTYGYI